MEYTEGFEGVAVVGGVKRRYNAQYAENKKKAKISIIFIEK